MFRVFRGLHRRIYAVAGLPPAISGSMAATLAGGDDNAGFSIEKISGAKLNTKLRIKRRSIISIGCLNEAMAHPREVLRPAFVGAAAPAAPATSPSARRAGCNVGPTIGRSCAWICRVGLVHAYPVG